MTGAITADRCRPWTGHDADDLATLFETLDLEIAMPVGHSAGGEVVRYISRRGTTRLAKAVLLGAVPPLMMLKTAAKPGGLPIEAFDNTRAATFGNRAQAFKDSTRPRDHASG
jgi:non-heme chloroperoxidase